jgi:Rod binding domain-containing protein
MNGVGGINAGGLNAAPTDSSVQLKRLADELESVFLNQLFQAMRQSVPDGGLGESSPGEEMFTAMLDEQLAKEAAFKWERGLGEELYRQLSRRLVDQPTVEL